MMNNLAKPRNQVGRPRKSQSPGIPEPSNRTVIKLLPATMAMTVEGVARELQISRSVAYRLVLVKGFPVFKIGRKILVNRKMLQEWMDGKTKEQMLHQI